MIALLALALLAAEPAVGEADGGAPDRAALDGGASTAAAAKCDPRETQQLLLEERRRLNQLLDRQQSILDALDEASHTLAQSELDARTADADEKSSKARLQLASAEADSALAALQARIRQLHPRLVARYRLERGGDLELLLSATSASDLLWRKRLMDRILQSDLAILGDTKAEATRLDLARKHEAQVEADHRAKQETLDRKLVESRRRKEELAALLQAVEEQREARERTLAELSQAAVHLESLAVRPPGMSFAGTSNFEKLKGKLPYPTQGRIEVGFGKVINPKFNTVVEQKGLDIRASSGQPVVAVAPGRVVHAGWLRGYGNLVIVDHGKGYFSLCAHLAAMSRASGDDVQAGDLLGQVGDTGSLKGPYLYFEIRKHGTPLDPGRWLASPSAALSSTSTAP